MRKAEDSKRNTKTPGQNFKDWINPELRGNLRQHVMLCQWQMGTGPVYLLDIKFHGCNVLI